MAKSFKPEDVRHIAKLANLKLRDHELEQYTAQFNRIVGYLDQLSQIPPERLSGSSDLFEIEVLKLTPMREDQPAPMLSNQQALANVPEKFAQFFLVPKVVDS